MGGYFCGGRDWNKQQSDLDHCFKLYFLREGTAEIVGENDCFSLESPGVYFINGYRVLSQSCKNDKMKVDWLHFIPESVYLLHILRHNSCVSKIEAFLPEAFDPLFLSLEAYFSGNLRADEMRVMSLEFQALVQLSLAQVLRLLELRWGDKDTSFKRLLPAIEYINAHLSDKILLKDMAEKCCLSPNYFQSLFSQAFDQSPNNYLKALRLQEAVRQLSYTNKPVSQIAYAIGYDDEAYFSRLFSKNYGISPSAYRKKHQGNTP